MKLIAWLKHRMYLHSTFLLSIWVLAGCVIETTVPQYMDESLVRGFLVGMTSAYIVAIIAVASRTQFQFESYKRLVTGLLPKIRAIQERGEPFALRVSDQLLVGYNGLMTMTALFVLALYCLRFAGTHDVHTFTFILYDVVVLLLVGYAHRRILKASTPQSTT